MVDVLEDHFNEMIALSTVGHRSLTAVRLHVIHLSAVRLDVIHAPAVHLDVIHAQASNRLS